MSETKTMDLLEQPFKIGSVSKMKNKAMDKYLSNIPASRMLWHLIKRYKFQLVLTWAILITISWAFPPFFDILRSMI